MRQKNQASYKFKSGFTLIEVMVVILILGILSVIVLAVIAGARDDSKAIAGKKQISEIRSQAALYYSMNNKYNSSDSIDYTASGLDQECPSNLTESPSMLNPNTKENIVRLIDGAKSSLGPELAGSMRCFVANQSYAISVEINNRGKTFCIDSNQNPVENKVATPTGCK